MIHSEREGAGAYAISQGVPWIPRPGPLGLKTSRVNSADLRHKIGMAGVGLLECGDDLFTHEMQRPGNLVFGNELSGVELGYERAQA